MAQKYQAKHRELYDLKCRGAALDVGDLVLVKQTAWKGRHKIQDRWESGEYELVPCTTEPKQYALTHSCRRKKKNICGQALQRCKYPLWAINRARIKSQNPARKTITIKMARRKQPTKTYTWWCHINKG